AHRAWVTQYRKDVAAAEEAGEEAPAFSWNDSPLGDFIPKFQAAAEEYAGSDDAIPFLLWIGMDVAWLDADAGKAAIETLCTTHVKSEALEPLGRALGGLPDVVGEERAAELLAMIEAQSTVPSLVGRAVFARVLPLLEKAEMGTDAYNKAKAELTAAAESSKDSRLQSEVSKKLRIREAFGIGMVAPDIQGTDLDGTAFNLSDYKGKIIFVDFWGDW
ncbi:MAG: hypothetical protein ACI9F9_001742, partial [Candidatus Paceibacteria bacterium]